MSPRARAVRDEPAAQTGWVRALAPAKINPWLEILGRRADGYHELETVMLALDLCDELRARARREPGIALRICGPCASADVRADADNLVWRAAAGVLKCAEPSAGLELELVKRIPSRAGLGGGSSDAAAGVLAAARALGFELSAAARRALLAELGSDCAFFVEAQLTGHALCKGRGERVRELPAPRAPLALALFVPEVGAPTAAVYAALASPLSAPRALPSLPRSLFDLEVGELRAALFNRLEAPALRAVPELAPLRARLDALGLAHWRMSGSGSAFFGLYREAEEAERELARLVAHSAAAGARARLACVCRPAGHGARLA